MKELRPTNTIRIFFAFDPARTAVLLIGGDKRGHHQQRWYRRMINQADRLYEEYLKESGH